jgi:hypothetical protein
MAPQAHRSNAFGASLNDMPIPLMTVGAFVVGFQVPPDQSTSRYLEDWLSVRRHQVLSPMGSMNAVKRGLLRFKPCLTAPESHIQVRVGRSL